MMLRTRQDGGGTPASERWGIDSEHGVLRDLLVGPIDHYVWTPGNAVAQRSERSGLTFDKAVAEAQYGEMIAAYRQAGVTVHTLAAEPGLPYQLYARDSSVMTPWGAIIMQLQKPYRRGEYAAVLRFYLENDIPIYDMVTAGNVEGGDFMLLKPGLAVCGFSGERSIEPAVQQLRGWFEAEGWEFLSYAFDPHFLHLDVQMGMVAEDLAVLCVEAVDPAFVRALTERGIRILDISYGDAMNMGTNVVALGNERVLVPAGNQRLIEQCRAEGLEVLDPDVAMIAAGGGSVHCMCQALRRDPA
ncbi:MAG: arginine deiminase family protein [Halieaceae bacterium]|jgi:N-dimethylarginine dimethylaminohydrolase|nr:arginine deiminase family protein [Halieaceae bacterium]